LQHTTAVERHAGEGTARRRVRAGNVSVGVAVALMLLKLAAGLYTNSLSLLASAVDSLTDIFASVVNLFAIRAAARPADWDHAYGHEKAESLAGLFQGTVITLSGVYLGYESVHRMIDPRPVEAAAVGAGVMVVSTVVSLWLVRYLRRVARETNSLALSADSVHFSTDVLTNVGVLATLVVIRFSGWMIVDPIVSLAISCYIIFAAWTVVRDSVDNLMDRALPEELQAQVREIVLRKPGILGVHDIKTRASGSRRFIEMHVEVDGSKSLREAHDDAVAALRAVEAEIPNSKVFVHTDPV
jgi:ferrous-iron efflux pump FieF